MPIKKAQQSMSGGELSPSLHNRVDLAKYHSGLKTCRNSYANKHGGASNRAGFQYVGDAEDHAVVARLIPFQFNTEQTYMLEFGHQVLRVIKDGAYVIDSGSPPNIYEIATPYIEADLPLIKFTQTADVMTLTHPSYDPRELSRTDHDAWTISTITFGPTLAAPTHNTTGSTELYTTKAITAATQTAPPQITIVGHGLGTGDTCVITGVVGMTQLNNKSYKVRKVDADNISLTGINASGYSAYVSGGTVYEKASYYGYKVVGINDETKEKTLPMSLNFGPAKFPLSDIAHNVISWNAVSGISKYDVYKEDNGFYGYIGTAEGLSFIDDNILPDYTDTPEDAQAPFAGSGNNPGCVAYHEQRRVFGRTNNERQTVFGTQTGNYKNMNTSFPTKDSDAYTFTIAARQVNEIRHIVSLSDMMIFTSGGVWKMNGGGASDAITPSNVLVRNQSNIGCSDIPPALAGDYVLFVEDGEDIINEIDYSFDRDKYVAIDRTLLASHLFDGDTVREIAYSRKPESIVWCVMNSGKLLGMTYVPEQEIWAWHWHETDGAFESISSIREGTEDAVYVIVKRTINGSTKRYVERLHTRKFSDVRDCFFVDSGLSLDNPIGISSITKANPCVVTTSAAHGLSAADPADLSDIVGMAELNDKQFLAKTIISPTQFAIANLDNVDIDSTGYSDYVSGGYSRKAVKTISGLDHLEGKTVSVLANGNVVSPNPVVTSGAITLVNASSRVHVGLPYISDIETLDIDTIDGRMNAKKINVTSVQVQLLKSRGMWAGPNSDKLTEWKQRGLAGEDYGEATNLFTGEAEMGIKSMWRSGGGTLIRQQYPLPLTVLTITPKVSMGG